jgi:putative aldouronate transport system permease protein
MRTSALHRRRTLTLQIFLILPVAYFLVFHYAPIYGLLIAFKDFKFRLGILGSPWAGLDNFSRFLEYPYALRIIRNTFLLNVYHLLWGFPAPIILALALNEVRHQGYKRFVQTVSYLPHFISTAAIVGILTTMLSPTSGFINKAIQAFGGEPVFFLIRPEWFRTLYIGSDIWQGVGWGAILYLAALSQVDPELHDAAVVDGCSRLRRIWHINLPTITPTITILLILNVGRMLSVGAEKIVLLYNPNTYETADVLSSFVYRTGIVNSDFSYATAVGMISTVANFVLVVAANAVSRRISDTSLW